MTFGNARRKFGVFYVCLAHFLHRFLIPLHHKINIFVISEYVKKLSGTDEIYINQYTNISVRIIVHLAKMGVGSLLLRGQYRLQKGAILIDRLSLLAVLQSVLGEIYCSTYISSLKFTPSMSKTYIHHAQAFHSQFINKLFFFLSCHSII